jgi:hypothetical protein
LKDADWISQRQDGTKSRAHNSKKANQSKEIERHLVYIEAMNPRISSRIG